jgi:hypothetical protein
MFVGALPPHPHELLKKLDQNFIRKPRIRAVSNVGVKGAFSPFNPDVLQL